MERDKIPRVIAGTDTFVTDPEDEGPDGGAPHCFDLDQPGEAGVDAESDSDEEASSHWGQWLRPE
ncbi:hypothetical protein ABT095_16255 [Kitasatospora sp. NPDC002227]|uniref:hypothetical protein n=1 Tax=Kitasatospora sp. NPDC002227 TaxID=3154773 RepID=UPI00331AFA13